LWLVLVVLQVMAVCWQSIGVGGWCRLLEPSFESELAVVLHVMAAYCRWRGWGC